MKFTKILCHKDLELYGIFYLPFLFKITSKYATGILWSKHDVTDLIKSMTS